MIVMPTTIPRNLTFVKDSLYDEEGEKVLGWYSTLQTPDRRNVGRFLRHSYAWMSDEAERLRQAREQYQNQARQEGREPNEEFLKGDYFIVSAIGSTARGEQSYNDVDLLIVTNRIWRDMGSLEANLLGQRLAKGFDYSISPTALSAYERPWGRPDRTLVTLDPKGKGKKLHVTVQPEIRSERYWEKHDEDPKVVLYRFGDTRGYYDEVEGFLEGMKLLGKFVEVRRYKGFMELSDDQVRIQNSNDQMEWDSYEFPDHIIQSMKERTLTESGFVEALLSRNYYHHLFR